MDIIHLATTDIIVLGGGQAALSAAVAARKANPQAHILLMSKSRLGLGGSSLVSVSVHRFAPNEDQLRKTYAAQFAHSAQGINNPELLKILIDRGHVAVQQMQDYGIPLEIKKCMDAAGILHPCLACAKPKYGRILSEALAKHTMRLPNMAAAEGYMAVELLVKNGTIQGVLAEKKNKIYSVFAPCIILATGGCGRIYANTSTTNDLTGDGQAMALRAGIALTDIEFFQFYPYRIYAPHIANIFPDIFEHGAKFINEKGVRFMDAFPKKEVENRDVLAREMFHQKKIILSLEEADLSYLKEECAAIYQIYQKNPDREILVRPVAHFSIGGIPLRADCTTQLSGLYICGEVAGGLHGANRLAGSALTETLVFGEIAGQQAAAYVQAQTFSNCINDFKLQDFLTIIDYPSIYATTEPASVYSDVDILALRALMWQYVSILRNGDELTAAIVAIKKHEKSFLSRPPANLRAWLEGRNLFTIAKAVTICALHRQESRGAHFRTDYPQKDSSWQGNTYYNGQTCTFHKTEIV